MKKALWENGFPEAERSPANMRSWDIQNIPSTHGNPLHKSWVVECKFSKNIRFFEWIPKARTADPIKVVEDGVETVSQNEHWCIIYRHGDTRTKMGSAVGEFAVLDKDVFLDMLRVYEGRDEPQDPIS